MILQDMLKNGAMTTSRECHGVDVHFEILRRPRDVSKWYKKKQTNFLVLVFYAHLVDLEWN